MQPDYWRERWPEGRIGFHRAEANPLLIEHQAVFNESTRVLVPLCGKSVDLEWLVIHGFQVVGVELSELAAQAFFSERGLAPQRREQRAFVVYEHGNLAIWVGDFFATSSVDLGIFDAVYDDAALIALPAELRRPYASQLQTLIAPKAKLLLITSASSIRQRPRSDAWRAWTHARTLQTPSEEARVSCTRSCTR